MWADLFRRIPKGVWYILASCVVLLTLTVSLVVLAGGSLRWGSFAVESPTEEIIIEELPQAEPAPAAEPDGGLQQKKQ